MLAKSYAVRVVLLLASFCLPAFRPALATSDNHDSARGFVSYEAPALLAYDELVEMSRATEPPEQLRSKLGTLLTTPIISNEAFHSGTSQVLSQNEKLGRFIRVGQWNVQRGINLDNMRLALENPEEFIRRIKTKPDTEDYRAILDQLDALRRVDVLAINEADLGIKRTAYRDVARELAECLKMNYAYGVEFLEIDPLNLGTEEFQGASAEHRARLKQAAEVDKERYRGLQGTAILSRFPIKHARLVPFEYQPYDWYKEGRNPMSIAESARRKLGRLAFLEQTPRQLRFGRRSLLIAELEVPQIPEGSITVVSTHLENFCGPEERRRQMQEALAIIRDIKGPVVIAGDLNTSGLNLTPTTIRAELMKRLRNKAFWIKRAVKAVVSLGPLLDFTIEAVCFARTAHDPTSKGFFIFGPNKEAALLKDIERMRFSDGYAFDFRGDSSRTINGTAGTLANSNQRAKTKGFLTTHSLGRTIWAVGKNKLDWILVKAYAKDPKGASEPYRLAPHFPRTLDKLNNSIGRKLSDHNPITVDLPIEEPNSLSAKDTK